MQELFPILVQGSSILKAFEYSRIKGSTGHGMPRTFRNIKGQF